VKQEHSQVRLSVETPRAGDSAKKPRFAATLVCVAIVVLMMIWPSDAPWGGDDAALVKLALRANREHFLAPAGLGGSFGYPYGPVPLQIYQVLLLFTHHLPTLVQLHAALFAGMTAAALLWLTRTLRWSPWLAAMPMLSPFFWFYGRLLWDNTFAIPIGAMLVAAYTAFLRRESGTAFIIALACAVILLLIHPMTLPLVAAVGAHAIWHHRQAFGRHLIALIVVVICTAFTSGNYFLRIGRQFAQSPKIPIPLVQPEQTRLSRPAAFAFPLRAGRLLSAYHFFDWRGTEPGPDSSAVARAARIVSTLAFGLCWLGMAVCIIRFRAGWRRNGKPADALAAICILALGLQCLLDGVLQIAPWPHYFGGTWIACVVCFWLGLRQLARLRLGRLPLSVPVGIAFSLATAFATAAFVVGIHRAGGGKAWYGATMGTQLQVLNVN
jgi:hypothetical protein